MRYVAIDGQNDVEMMLMTADRRDWRVRIDLGTLGRLAEHRIASDEDARGTVNQHMTSLIMGTLRVIGRGGVGDVVRLSAADLRLPPIAKAA